jgi:hypothetical protein
MRDEHCGICDQHGVDVGGDDIVPVPQHERSVTLIDKLLLELAKSGFRTSV